MTVGNADSAAGSTLRRRPGPGAGVALSIVATGVIANLATAVVATIARGPAGVSHDFRALQPGSYLSLTIVGATAGAIGWAVIRHRSKNPTRLLRRLVPAAVLLSLIPDVMLGATHTQPHTTWGGVAALMVMHLVVTAVAVTSYRRFLPLPTPTR